MAIESKKVLSKKKCSTGPIMIHLLNGVSIKSFSRFIKQNRIKDTFINRRDIHQIKNITKYSLIIFFWLVKIPLEILLFFD